MARYLLMGHEVVGVDDNKRAMALEQQRLQTGAAVVYETDDLKEAETIVQAGGFFRDRDNFVAVESYVDRQNTISGRGTADIPAAPLASPFPQKSNPT